MINNYSELIEEVVSLLSRNFLRAKVPNWISFAEAEIVRGIISLDEIRYKTTGTLTTGVESITLPAGINGIKGFQLDENPIRTVISVSMPELLRRRALDTAAADTFPSVYAWVDATTIEMAPTPGAGTSYTLYYTGRMVDPDELKYTSKVLVDAPDLLLYGTAKHSAPYLRHDERIAVWEQMFDRKLPQYAAFLDRQLDSIQVSTYSAGRDYPQTTGSF